MKGILELTTGEIMMNANENVTVSTKDDQNFELKDDVELLDMMLTDSKGQLPVYQPGPYWTKKAKNAANNIQRYGITDFRGSTNLIGLSYADNLYIDIRETYNYGLKSFARLLTKIYPLSKIYESQVRWTESYANENVMYAEEILNNKCRTRNLLEKYTVPYSLLGKCLRKAEIGSCEYSIHYLNLIMLINFMVSLESVNLQ